MASIQELGPRQRMINMMYIIFIAMLALNMSKEVLRAFGDVNDSLTTNIEQTDKRNTGLMAGLAQKAEDQPEKYKPLQQAAQEIDESSKDLVSYIDKIKEELVADIDRDDKGNLEYKSMDRDDDINTMFFANDKLTPRAQKLVEKIDTFRNQAMAMADIAGQPKLKESIAKKFDTSPIKIKDGGNADWFRYNFEGYPLIAGITKFTNIQANAKQVESDLLSSLVSGQLESDVSMTNYEAIVVPDKTAFFSGENFTGKIYLGRVDKSLKFDKVIINGHEVKTVEAGQVNLDFPAGNVGEQKIAGELQFKEGDSIVPISVKSSYAVIPKPNAAVISADKMNVVYRGVKNPLTISIPGVPNVNASAPGMTHTSGAKYVLDPTNIKARKVSIKVTGKLPNGEPVSDSKEFRIKEIPAPTGTIRGEDGGGGPVKLQRNGLKISKVNAMIKDFDFDLKLAVSGFKLQVPGKPIVEVHGTQMNAAAKRAIDGAKRGSTILIFDIRAKIAGNSSYHLPSVTPVTVQLTN